MLGIDIGNTTITFGIFNNDELTTKFTLPSNVNQEIADLLKAIDRALQTVVDHNWRDQFKPKEIVLSSVVPQMDSLVISSLENFFKIEVKQLMWNNQDQVDLMIENPETLGADRLANAIACKCIYGLPAINIDIGTAITIDYINEHRQFVGGVIFPGPVSALDGLAHHAARLPKVEFVKPYQVIGKHTKEAIQAGVYFGWLEMSKAMCERFQQEQGPVDNIILTGGLSDFFIEEFPLDTIHDPDLTLKGLYNFIKTYE